MTEINPNIELPNDLIIESIDDILYGIGLPIDSVIPQPKRKWFFHPILVFSFVSFYLIKELISSLLSDENELYFKVMGNYGHFMGIRRTLSLAFVLFSSFILSSQLIYYYNQRNGIKPTFLRVFKMMSGLVTPKNVGLTDVKYIRKLLKTTKVSIKLLKVTGNLAVPMGAFLMMTAIYYVKTSLIETLMFGIPNGILYSIWCLYVILIFDILLLSFYIICSQINFKIQSLNERIEKLKKSFNYYKIREILHSFDSLYKEINEYNTTFWSKFLFAFWLTFGSCDVLLIHICIFGSVEIWLKLFLVYVSVFLGSLFLFIIFTASSVNSNANKTYKSLNSLIIPYSRYNRRKSYARFTSILKVTIKFIFNLLIIFLFALDKFIHRESSS